MRLGLVTCRGPQASSGDTTPLIDALDRSGIAAETVAWDDPDTDPSAFDGCLLHTPWNYHLAPGDFVDWADAADRVSQLFNPASVVRWNIHKRYLAELETKGISIVPTLWLARGDEPRLADSLKKTGWRDVMIKPAISASSFRTGRFSATDREAAERFAADLTRDRDAMVQPYLATVEKEGERSLIVVDGLVTHAVVKRPRFSSARRPKPIAEASDEITSPERVLAQRILACAPGPLVYARIDLIPSPSGRPLLSELELIEPELYLRMSPEALRRLAATIRTRLVK